MKRRRISRRLGRGIATAFAGALEWSCSPAVPPGAISLSDDVFVEELGDGLWRHVSHRLLPPAGLVPSNGLVVPLPNGALVVDTAWTPEQTAVVLDWAEEQFGAVQAVLVTHAHDDRVGGIETVQRRGIPSYGLAQTSTRGQEQGWPALSNTFEQELSLSEFGIEGEAYFPGSAHTPDNVVVWLAASRTLFGSCMVRALSWSIGNLNDAVLQSWPSSARVLEARYATALRVVPGHGEIGGIDLLAHTRELADTAARESAD